MSLSEARVEHHTLMNLLKRGHNPADVKREGRTAAEPPNPKPPVSAATKLHPESPHNSFGAVESEWFAHWSKDRDTEYVEQMRGRLENDIMPVLGNRPINEVEAPEIVQVVKVIDARGAHELARKALRTIRQIFRYAIAHGYAMGPRSLRSSYWRSLLPSNKGLPSHVRFVRISGKSTGSSP